MEKSTIWNNIRVWFHDSETIVWARLQMLGGVLVIAASSINWSALMDTSLTFKQAGWLGGVMLFQGLITEVSRRVREPHNLGVKTIADLNTVMLPIKQDDKVDVDKDTGTVTVTKAIEIPTDVTLKATNV